MFSEQNLASNISVTENKKKKERRKDKENAGMETSDEEAANLQGMKNNLRKRIEISNTFLI